MTSKLTLRGIVFSSLFAALLVVFSFFNLHLGFSPVPISLENLIVMLAGGLLGASYGFFSMALIVVLTTVGLPLLQGSGGLAVILGPTGGYVWAYPLSALLIGFFLSRFKGNSWVTFVLTFITLEVFGSLLLYVTGVPWLAHVAKFPLHKAMILGCYPYLPGDAIKAFVATIIIFSIKRVYPSGINLEKQQSFLK